MSLNLTVFCDGDSNVPFPATSAIVVVTEAVVVAAAAVVVAAAAEVVAAAAEVVVAEAVVVVEAGIVVGQIIKSKFILNNNNKNNGYF